MHNAIQNDYGGYNVNFYNNLNVAWGNKAGNQACWNIEATIMAVQAIKCIIINVLFIVIKVH